MRYLLLLTLIFSITAKASDVLDIDKAVRAGDLATVSAMLEKGVSPSIVLSEGKNKIWQHSPLIIATKNNNIEIAKLLIGKGADVNYANIASETALISATKKDYAEIASILIKSGADVNYVDENEYSVLYWAVSNKSKNVIPMLLEAGADPNMEYNSSEYGVISLRDYFTKKGEQYSDVVEMLK